jgi:hypothetical protein
MSLIVKPVPIPIGAKHPLVPFKDILPQHEFTLMLIAPKGSGKTTLLVNLLDFYKGYFHNIIIFSPTIKADEKWLHAAKQPYLTENKALTKFLAKQDKKKYIEIVEKATAEVKLNPKKFDPLIPKEMMKTEFDGSLLKSIMDEQMHQIEALEKLGGTKHIANRILLIFDDMVGSELYGRSQKNVFKMLNTNHRHHSMSLLMVTQAYKEIHDTVRNNATGLLMFEIPNEKELFKIYEENPSGLNFKNWLKVYKYATSDEYGFLYINHYRKQKKLRIMKNFDEYIFINND